MDEPPEEGEITETPPPSPPPRPPLPVIIGLAAPPLASDLTSPTNAGHQRQQGTISRLSGPRESSGSRQKKPRALQKELPSPAKDGRLLPSGAIVNPRILSTIASTAELSTLFPGLVLRRYVDVTVCSDPAFEKMIVDRITAFLGDGHPTYCCPVYFAQACYAEHFKGKVIDYARLVEYNKVQSERRKELSKIRREEKRGVSQEVSEGGESTQEEMEFSEGDETSGDEVEEGYYDSDSDSDGKDANDGNGSDEDDVNVGSEAVKDVVEQAKVVDTQVELAYGGSDGHHGETRPEELPVDGNRGETALQVLPGGETSLQVLPGGETALHDGNHGDTTPQGLPSDGNHGEEELLVPRKPRSRPDNERIRELEKKLGEAEESLGQFKSALHKSEHRRLVAEMKAEEAEMKTKQAETLRTKSEMERAEAEQTLKNIKAGDMIRQLRPSPILLEKLRGPPLSKEVFWDISRNVKCPICDRGFTSEGWYTLGCGHRHHLQCLFIMSMVTSSCHLCGVKYPDEFYHTIQNAPPICGTL